MKYRKEAFLGPILFLLYFNELNDVFENLFVSLFADDTLISIASKMVKV